MFRFIFPSGCLLFILTANTCYAQNRIILSSGDTIVGTISKVSKNYLYFKQDVHGVSTSGRIKKDNVREWTYFQQNSIEKKLEDDVTSTEKVIIPGIQPEKEKNLSGRHKIMASVTSGFGYLLGDTREAAEQLKLMGVNESAAQNYYNHLKFGAQVKSSLHIFLGADYWLGLIYNGFHSNAEIVTPIQMDDEFMYYGKLGERNFVNFTGISLYSSKRYGSKEKIGLNSSFGIGPAFYRDEVEMYGEQVLITATSPGFNTTLGLEYFFQSRLSLGVEAGFFLSKVSRIKVKNATETRETELDKENYENLSRADFSVSLNYYW